MFRSFWDGVEQSCPNYIRRACALPVLSDAQHPSNELWPCPIPACTPAPRTRLAGRRKARWVLRLHRNTWVRLLVAAGNFLVSGRPEIPAHAMQPPSRAQESMIAQFERHVAAWVRLGTGPRRELDRAVQKFSILEDQLSYLRDRSPCSFCAVSTLQQGSGVSSCGL